MEDLRQKCIYHFALKNDNIFIYLNYLKAFHSECLIKNELAQFNEKCSKGVLYSDISPIKIDACISRSFKVNDLLSNLYIDNENILLGREYVHHSHLYQIYLNGIIMMLLI